MKTKIKKSDNPIPINYNTIFSGFNSKKTDPLIFILCIIFIFLISSFSVHAQITREQAVEAILEAEIEILEMRSDGFPVKSLNDSLIAADHALERADFANLIRSGAAGELAEQARRSLEGLDYEGFTYEDVLGYTEDIRLRKQKAYFLSDSIGLTKKKAEEFKKEGINVSYGEKLIDDAVFAFEKERYLETENILSEADNELELRKAEFTTINIIIRTSKNFFERYWWQIILLIILFIPIGWALTKRLRIEHAKEKLKKMQAQQRSLKKLIKEVQIDRFRKGVISSSTYDIRMKKYNSRLNDTKQKIPVLKDLIKKIKRSSFKDFIALPYKKYFLRISLAKNSRLKPKKDHSNKKNRKNRKKIEKKIS